MGGIIVKVLVWMVRYKNVNAIIRYGGEKMKVEVVIVLVLGIFCWLYCRKAKRSIAGMKKEQLEAVYRKKDKGEALHNILSTVYLSTIFFLLNYESITMQMVISTVICMLFIFVALNVKLYMYKLKIRELEKE